MKTDYTTEDSRIAAGIPKLTMRSMKHGTVSETQFAKFTFHVKLNCDRLFNELVDLRTERKELQNQLVALSLERVDIEADIERMNAASEKKGN
ncbi:hypothetical protein N9Z70_04735 [Mariniblastus sp.]|nr:hypothetical protein [Mariniblastus sp.]